MESLQSIQEQIRQLREKQRYLYQQNRKEIAAQAQEHFGTARKYNIVYLDPPWSYPGGAHGRGGTKKHYPTMTDEEIAAMPVGGLAKDDAALLLWCPFKKIELIVDLMAMWGFTYFRELFIWVKLNPKKGNFCTGTGRYTRANPECLFVGLRGNIDAYHEQLKNSKEAINAIFQAPRREHSRKPDEVRDWIVSIFGDLPRIEIFARQAIRGWDVWGNDTDHFEADPDDDIHGYVCANTAQLLHEAIAYRQDKASLALCDEISRQAPPRKPLKCPPTIAPGADPMAGLEARVRALVDERIQELLRISLRKGDNAEGDCVSYTGDRGAPPITIINNNTTTHSAKRVRT